ncbi:MAG TPA: methyltransferase domain-containing protein [Rhodospirillaceae bacterium]|nr:methyltransferase domain-containing protein [Rhodospirillaceae bacterium]
MQNVRRHFAGRAATYQADCGRGLWAWQRRREEARLFSLTGPVAGRTALDLGCGSGFYARRLADRGAEAVTAVDLSPEMIAALDDPRIAARVGDLATVRLERRFDLVILAGALEFSPAPAAALANAGNHLAEGGRLVALLPRDNWAGRLYRRFHRRHGITVGLFSRRDLDGLAAPAGLAVEAWRTVFPFAAACRMVRR